MPTMTLAAKIELENLTDQYGLAAMLDALATIASEKADHIRVNWQDNVTAGYWNCAARRVAKAAVAAGDYVG